MIVMVDMVVTLTDVEFTALIKINVKHELALRFISSTLIPNDME